jgi:hypothetical protein
LLGSELLYAIPHNGEIACHLGEPHQLRRNRGRGGEAKIARRRRNNESIVY